jgi:cytochrome d ubiquinol oxidase subunit II
MMAAVWFALVAIVLAAYVVMDGFDFGAGALHTRVARSDRERRQVLAAIGPYWDGNEVWLLAAGGMLFLAFPKVLAAGLSGFYMAIFLVLWVLILRGISIEFRSHLHDRMWRAFWDATFAFASTLAPVLLGVALGNVVRGVPLNADGWFALPLFASFSPHGELGILDWYSLVIGALAYVAILHHGALFLAWKTDGVVRERALRHARTLWWATVVAWSAALAATIAVAPHVFSGWGMRPLAPTASAVFLLGLAASLVARRRGRDRLAFVGSAAFLAGSLAAVLAALYPTMLRSSGDPRWSLTAVNAAANARSLRLGLLWWPAGFALAVVYVVVLLRLHRGKVQAAADGEGY